MRWQLVAVLVAICGCEGAVGGGDDEALEPAPEGLAEDLTGLASYPIEGGALGEPAFHEVPADLEDAREDTEAHEAMWAFAERAFASHMRWMGRFVVFTDGLEGTLAQVFTLPDAPRRWALAVDFEDALDDDGEVGGPELRFTLVHELAHIVALNADQVAFDPELAAAGDDEDVLDAKREACATYFVDEGCAKPGSYLLAFREAFWSDLADEEAAADAADEDEEAALAEALYARAPDRFVSDYAATNPVEDFAESFGHYVLGPDPEGDAERDEKVRFFDEFAALADLRDDLRAAGFRPDGTRLQSLRARRR